MSPPPGRRHPARPPPPGRPESAAPTKPPPPKKNARQWPGEVRRPPPDCGQHRAGSTDENEPEARTDREAGEQAGSHDPVATVVSIMPGSLVSGDDLAVRAAWQPSPAAGRRLWPADTVA